MKPQEHIIATTESQVGYFGKKTNAQLDDFTANAGGKWNKYARDLDDLGDFYNGRKNGYDWCDVFVDWCFVQTFGRELAQKLLCQPDKSCGAGTAYSLNYYKQQGRLFTSPEPADQIFFGDATSTWHTGLVVKVEGGFVHTVEGNAGSPAAVRACKYALSYQYIKGYGRPDWSLVADKSEEDDDMDVTRFKELWSEMRKELQDNDSGQWSAEARAWATSTSLIAGMGAMPNGEQNYAWADVLTREQMAVLFYRFAKMMGRA